MDTMMKKTILIMLLLAMLSACVANPGVDSEAPAEVNLPDAGNGYQANAIKTKDLILTIKTDEFFDGNERQAFSQALDSGRQQFTINNITYHYEPLGEFSYRIFRLTPVAESLLGEIHAAEGVLLSDEMIAAIQKAIAENVLTFEHQGITYVLSEERKAVQISTVSDVAVASQYYLEVYNSVDNETIQNFEFALNLALAIEQGAPSFTYKQESYGILPVPGGYTISDPQSNLFAEFSNIYVIPRGASTDIPPMGFKNLVRDAVENGKTGFTYTDTEGEVTDYKVEKLENTWSISPK
ncbi:MAG: hypothetical protein PHR54_04030 [Anaerolineaceae bacterium]|nr:hypothetical protein [Anaerolineaceae bacterium]